MIDVRETMKAFFEEIRFETLESKIQTELFAYILAFVFTEFLS